MKKYALLFAGMFMVFALSAQRTISGTLTDENDQALIGATIQQEGTAVGTVSDVDGTYSITVTGENPVLIYSYTGFLDERVTVGASNVLDVTLRTDVVGLDEVVVLGYAPQRRKDITGAVSSVNTDRLQDVPIPSFEVALQGTAAGVNVTKNSGKPGGGIDVNIRGRTSITASNQPLYVVDGVPVISGDNFDFSQEAIGGSQISVLADIAPEDIESIEVLKDASTAAIYGSRAANGVVLITTKKGSSDGETRVNFNASYGNAWLPRTIEGISGEEYMDYTIELYGDILDANGLDRTYEQIEANILGPLGNASTNWQEEIFRTATIQKYGINLSGGNQKTKFYTSLGYSDEEGIMNNSGFNRYNGRLNVDHFMNDKLAFGVNMGYTRSDTRQVQNDNNIFGALGASILIPPVVPIRNEDGSFGSAFGIENAVAATTEYQNNIIRGRLNGSVYGKWSITDNLSFKALFGADVLDLNESIFEPRTLQSSPTGRAVQANAKNERFINEYTLGYNTSFNESNLNIILGTSFQQDKINSTYAEAVEFPTDDFTGLSSGASPVTTNGSFTGDNLQSFFANVNFGLTKALFFTGTFRADGSSRFVNEKWGYFPGFSVGWNLVDQGLISGGDNLNLLKLRVGWGQTGNNVFSNFDALQLYGGGRNYLDAPGTAPTQIGNPDLKWETTTQLNAGIDFGLIKNRLNGSLDFYIKDTEDLLLDRPIPTTSGFLTVTQNVGEVKNTGVDLTLNSVNIQKSDFVWATTFTLGYLKNEVIKLVDGIPFDAGFATRVAEGQPMGSFFGHQTDGLFQNQGEIEDHASQPGAAPGDIRFVDIGGGAGEDNIVGTDDDLDPDGIINDNDRTYIGKALPDFSGGLRNTLAYKGFDLDFFFQFATGFQIYNNNLAFAEGMNSVFAPTKNAWDNRWKQEGDNTEIPRLIRNDPNGNRRDSERFVEDGDYIRLKTLTLGYTIPKSNLESIGVRSIRLYVSGYNLWTATGYSWFDPEVNMFDGNNNALGTDFLTFPQSRSVIFGINLGF